MRQKTIYDGISIVILSIALVLEYLFDFSRDCVVIQVILKDTFPEPIAQIDKMILLWINPGLLSKYLTPVMTFLTLFGGIIFIAGLLSVVAVRERKRSVSLIFILVVSIVLAYLLKELFARPRPFMTIPGVLFLTCSFSPSFPSGHTMRIATVAGVFHRLYGKWVGYIMLILSTLVGFSRLYLGVHYPSDVIFSLLTGYALGYVLTPYVERRLLTTYEIKDTSSTPNIPQ